jgi:hypothetical protein
MPIYAEGLFDSRDTKVLIDRLAVASLTDDIRLRVNHDRGDSFATFLVRCWPAPGPEALPGLVKVAKEAGADITLDQGWAVFSKAELE